MSDLRETLRSFFEREIATLEDRVFLLRTGKLRIWSQALDGLRIESTQDEIFLAETRLAETTVQLRRLEADDA